MTDVSVIIATVDALLARLSSRSEDLLYRTQSQLESALNLHVGMWS